MSVMIRVKDSSYVVRTYYNGKIKHIATYRTLQDAEEADILYHKCGVISDKGRKLPVVIKTNTSYMGNFTEKFYAAQLKKQIDNKKSLYNEHCVRRYNEPTEE